ncbi:MAG: phosphoglycerate mutase (2,3-diphosphoglycerate-independent), partial [Candidatus Sungbacteria bacterium RIFCSPLOWO2_02_FULL_47_9]
MKSYRPVILIILDGFGISAEIKGNPIQAANKPMFDFLEKNFPFTTIQASSTAVGLPYGEAGNSEVGHLTIGAGRPIHHHLPRIIYSIRDRSFFKNEAFLKAIEHVRQNSSSLHLMGLASSGSVHSYIEHLYALLELLKEEHVEKNVFLHVMTDGKDAPPKEGGEFLPKLSERLAAEFPFATIVSVIGRSFAMDRDGRWEKIKKAYELFTVGVGEKFINPIKYIEDSYARELTDQFIEPGMLVDSVGNAVGRIRDNDALIMYNFREDSEREIAETFVKKDFMAFERTPLSNFLLVTMTEYEEGLPALSAFSPLQIRWCLSELISETGKNQLHIAESEKYAHITYFFNGGREEPFPHEERILIPSPRTSHFDESPAMNARGVKEAVLSGFASFDFIVANFANADMVGHTGNFDAVKQAIEVLDGDVGAIVERVLASDAVLVITGDHGNAEQKLNIISGEVTTKHTINAVPFFLIAKDLKLSKERAPEEVRKRRRAVGGILTDIAPTVLELLGIEKPPEMIGKSLFKTIVGKV